MQENIGKCLENAGNCLDNAGKCWKIMKDVQNLKSEKKGILSEVI